MPDIKLPRFTAATLPAPQQWEGKTIWRTDLGVEMVSNGLAWGEKITSLVSGYGNAIQGADKVTAPVQHLTSTAAISTTATIRIAPTGTFYTARVAWTNNGASGTAKLYVAANCGNDVEGLVASQSALQRDAQLTMGDALILASPTPITSLNFSADGSIVSNTHRLVVTFGA